jgi:predicted nucleic acid-binding Zn ribbon protein
MTLTKAEFDEARGSDTNGSAPPARRCAVCDKPLRPSQKRACSPRCGQKLGGRVAAARTKERASEASVSAFADKTSSTGDPFAFLASLPLEVTAVELAGWRCVRA